MLARAEREVFGEDIGEDGDQKHCDADPEYWGMVDAPPIAPRGFRVG
jgi:hypothetical protein